MSKVEKAFLSGYDEFDKRAREVYVLEFIRAKIAMDQEIDFSDLKKKIGKLYNQYKPQDNNGLPADFIEKLHEELSPILSEHIAPAKEAIKEMNIKQMAKKLYSEWAPLLVDEATKGIYKPQRSFVDRMRDALTFSGSKNKYGLSTKENGGHESFLPSAEKQQSFNNYSHSSSDSIASTASITSGEVLSSRASSRILPLPSIPGGSDRLSSASTQKRSTKIAEANLPKLSSSRVILPAISNTSEVSSANTLQTGLSRRVVKPILGL